MRTWFGSVCNSGTGMVAVHHDGSPTYVVKISTSDPNVFFIWLLWHCDWSNTPRVPWCANIDKNVDAYFTVTFIKWTDL